MSDTTQLDDDVQISELNFDSFDIDTLLFSIKEEIGGDAESPEEFDVDRAFSDRVDAEIMLRYNPDRRDSFRLEITVSPTYRGGELEIPVSPQTADDVLDIMKDRDGWHEELGLDLTVEDVRDELGIDIEEYRTEDA